MSNKSEGSLPSSLLYLLAASSTEDSLLSSPATDDLMLLGEVDEGAPTTAPSVEQKMFLVMSVALATVCFFTNAVQVTPLTHSIVVLLYYPRYTRGRTAVSRIKVVPHVVETCCCAPRSACSCVVGRCGA